jgi:hypothetical protein
MVNVRRGKPIQLRSAPERAVVPAPAGLRAKQFEIDGEEFAVLVYPLQMSTPAVSASLTAAEAEIAALVLRGFSNEEIAAKRSSSPPVGAACRQRDGTRCGAGGAGRGTARPRSALAPATPSTG